MKVVTTDHMMNILGDSGFRLPVCYDLMKEEFTFFDDFSPSLEIMEQIVAAIRKEVT